MYTEETLKFPLRPIKHSDTSSARTVSKGWNTYWALAVFAAVVTLALSVLLSSATSAGAFWPFNTTSAAETKPVFHDAKLALLKAAINSDPNPAKGGADIALSEGAALIAHSGPTGSAYLESKSSRGSITTYVVKEGDSLSVIAADHGVSMSTILWANDIKDPKLVKPGTELVILPVSGVKYEVKSGDTVAGVAKRFSGDADDIISYNGIDVGKGLVSGETIIIPGGSLPKAAAPAAKKASGAAARSLPAVSGTFGNPVPGGRCSQGIHGYNGVDIAAPSGTPIYAAAGGSVIVAKAGGYNGGYGSYVVIKHANGMQSLYAHMSRVATGGGAVEKGALLGYVGSTGKSTGNHLHFEVRGGTNPMCR